MSPWVRKMLGLSAGQPQVEAQQAPIAPFEYVRHSGPFAGRQMFRPIVYVFEHHILPQKFFDSSPELLQAFTSKNSCSDEFLRLWLLSVAACEGNGMLTLRYPGHTYDVDSYLRGLAQQVSCVRTVTANYSIWTMTGPAPKSTTEAHLLAFCIPNGPNSALSASGGRRRLFTLEASFPLSDTCFCEVQGNSRANFGSVERWSKYEFTNQVLRKLGEIAI